MNNNEQQWVTMGNNGLQWTTMDNYGQQWTRPSCATPEYTIFCLDIYSLTKKYYQNIE